MACASTMVAVHVSKGKGGVPVSDTLVCEGKAGVEGQQEPAQDGRARAKRVAAAARRGVTLFAA